MRSSALNIAKVDFAAGVKDVVSGPFAAMFEQGPSELTRADGAVTLRGRNHTIDTRGDAAADDLVSVGWGAVPDGHTVSLLAENAARVGTVKSRTFSGAGNVYLRGGDKRLSTLFPLILQRRRLAAAHFATYRAVHGNTSGVAVSAVMGGLQNSAAAIDGLRFKFAGGNITSGRIILSASSISHPPRTPSADTIRYAGVDSAGTSRGLEGA